MRNALEMFYKVPPRLRSMRRNTRRARIAAKRAFLDTCELLAIAAFVGFIGLVTPSRGMASEHNSANTENRLAGLSDDDMEQGVALSVLATYCGATVDDRELRAIERPLFRRSYKVSLAAADRFRSDKDRADVCKGALKTIEISGYRLGVTITGHRKAIVDPPSRTYTVQTGEVISIDYAREFAASGPCDTDAACAMWDAKADYVGTDRSILGVRNANKFASQFPQQFKLLDIAETGFVCLWERLAADGDDDSYYSFDNCANR